MKLYIKLTALFMVFAMLVGFSACIGKSGDDNSKENSKENSSEASAEDSSGDETTGEESAEDPVLTAFEGAVEALSAKTEVKQSIKSTVVRTFGTDVFEYEEESTAVYKGVGTEKVEFHVSDKVTSGYLLWKTDRIYSDGKYYHKDSETGNVYYKEMDGEAAVGTLLPIVLFDADIYETVSFKEGDESIIVLSDAKAVEAWAAPDYAKPGDLTAEIKLNADGEIESYTYIADYTQGPATYEVSYEVSLSVPDEKDEIVLPEEEGVKFDGAELLPVLKLVDAATKARVAYEYTGYTEVYSQAGGIAIVRDEDMYFHGKDQADFIGKMEANLEMYQYGRGEETQTLEQTYKDGELVTILDGNKTTQNWTMTQVLTNVIEKDENIGIVTPDVSLFESCEINDLVEFWHISYTLNEKGSQHFEDYINEFFYESKDVFGEYLEGYSAEKGEGFISIDKDTLFVTAAGVDYEGASTLEGDEYLSGFNMSVSFGVSDVDTYKEITGELPEETEPEEKATPLFYKVTDADGNVMYLLGTIHLGDSRTAYLPQEIYDAFDKCDALAVEFDLLNFEELLEEEDEDTMDALANSYYYTDGSTITDHIDEELYEAGLQHVLTAGMTPLYADYMTPSTWGSLIDDFYNDFNISLSSAFGVDYRFLRMAKDRGMEVLEVESAEEQYGMSEQYTDSIHKMLLYSSLFCTRYEVIDGVNELYEMWCEGDEEKLREYLNAEDDDSEIEEDIGDEELAEEMKEAVEQYNAILGADRDEGMVEKAKEYLESGRTVFYAVGLAHMISDTGLVDALRADGCTVELVSFSGEAAALSE